MEESTKCSGCRQGVLDTKIVWDDDGNPWCFDCWFEKQTTDEENDHEEHP